MKNLPPAGTPSTRVPAAFTLIELLVVISIIAVLAGILLPVSSGVMDNARRTEAKATEANIVTAVKNFQTDYGVYPNPAPAVNTDITFDGTNNQNLFNILRATGVGTDVVATSPNTRRIVYFEARDVKNVQAPKSGFLPFGASAVAQKNGAGSINAGALVDPWGNGFYVRYDNGYTDAVIHPYADGSLTANDTAGATGNIIRSGVIAWSYGKDSSNGSVKQGNNGTKGSDPNWTYGDDVVSWQ